jgi:hypothetical protein
MGDPARRKRRPKGINRPGLEERAIQSLFVEEERVKRAEATRIRQACHRSPDRRAEQLTQSLASGNQDEGDVAMTERTTNRVSKRLAAYVVGELRTCPSPGARRDVMEKLLNHNTVWPFLPGYYPRPAEAKAIFQFVESFRFELQAVKKGNLRDILARKGALLDAAVSLGMERSTALSQVLQTNPSNISAALERRVGLTAPTFFPLVRKKRQGLTEYIKATVRTWWHEHTRVSPNKKDVTRRRTGRKQYLVHPTHYLTDTQVRDSVFLLTNFSFLFGK